MTTQSTNLPIVRYLGLFESLPPCIDQARLVQLLQVVQMVVTTSTTRPCVITDTSYCSCKPPIAKIGSLKGFQGRKHFLGEASITQHSDRKVG